jgi:hypothetical protein
LRSTRRGSSENDRCSARDTMTFEISRESPEE